MKNTARPNPTRVRSLEILDGSQVLRELHCALYDDCLDQAIGQGWRGFTCSACQGFAPASPMAEKRALQGLLELTVVVLHGALDEEKCEAKDQPAIAETVQETQPIQEGVDDAA